MIYFEIWHHCDFYIISLAMNILEGWDILRHVISLNPFKYSIRKSKYKQNNMGLLISRHKNAKYIRFLKLYNYFDLLLWQLVCQKYFRSIWRLLQEYFEAYSNEYFKNFLLTASRPIYDWFKTIYNYIENSSAQPP